MQEVCKGPTGLRALVCALGSVPAEAAGCTSKGGPKAPGLLCSVERMTEALAVLAAREGGESVRVAGSRNREAADALLAEEAKAASPRLTFMLAIFAGVSSPRLPIRLTVFAERASPQLTVMLCSLARASSLRLPHMLGLPADAASPQLTFMLDLVAGRPSTALTFVLGLLTGGTSPRLALVLTFLTEATFSRVGDVTMLAVWRCKGERGRCPRLCSGDGCSIVGEGKRLFSTGYGSMKRSGSNPASRRPVFRRCSSDSMAALSPASRSA
jgi:hypothetical protein